MKYSRYSLLFGALSVGFTVVALASYRAIGVLAGSAARERAPLLWPEDTLAALAARIRAPSGAASYAELAAADETWRRTHARQYTLQELRLRGDGRRTPRQAMQDRVYRYTRVGDRARAILELQQWLRANRQDAGALLWLARLLNEQGRSREAIPLYRRALAIESAGDQR